MAKPQTSDAIQEPAPNFLAHLQQTFGWSEAQAIDALGAHILSSKAGRALRREFEAVESVTTPLNAA